MTRSISEISPQVLVTRSRHYIVVKIPRENAKMGVGSAKSFADMVGVLKNVAAFEGKTSVEVQHMIGSLWSVHGKNRKNS